MRYRLGYCDDVERFCNGLARFTGVWSCKMCGYLRDNAKYQLSLRVEIQATSSIRTQAGAIHELPLLDNADEILRHI